MKITKTIDGNKTIYFYDGVKKYEHDKNSDGIEWWTEYKDGKGIHYKDTDGYETWSEYENEKEIHYKNSDGIERWREYENGKEIHYKNSDGDETWSDDNPDNPKNRVELLKEEDIKPFEFSN